MVDLDRFCRQYAIKQFAIEPLRGTQYPKKNSCRTQEPHLSPYVIPNWTLNQGLGNQASLALAQDQNKTSLNLSLALAQDLEPLCKTKTRG